VVSLSLGLLVEPISAFYIFADFAFFFQDFALHFAFGR
jgi:hypothetical protein